MPVPRQVFAVEVVAVRHLPPQDAKDVFTAGDVRRRQQEPSARFQNAVHLEKEGVWVGREMLDQLACDDQIVGPRLDWQPAAFEIEVIEHEFFAAWVGLETMPQRRRFRARALEDRPLDRS